jgi:hypothetical protein
LFSTSLIKDGEEKEFFWMLSVISIEGILWISSGQKDSDR